ncbi:hypothetical protein [Anaerobacillus sp. 1_MG-2023]|uniref:hypothetical protein n=1 Tax=Anaerobacillus sp. 1_MG-2023 TaxID=3062655 RepID=UPI0026E18607|nr:hypothetical protein [Anaerobacillus sp. 1_MG-2023]MDO6654742.1 hypothetical protein [Anaerobacillus sp. 1_MG-2023]
MKKYVFYYIVGMISSFLIFCSGLFSLFGWIDLVSIFLSVIFAVMGFLGVLTNSMQLKVALKESYTNQQ